MKFPLAIALMLLVLINPVLSAEVKPEARSFATFWVQFKAAVANKNKDAIAGLTKFPFAYLSEQLAKADFIKQWDKIFSQKVQRCIRNAKPVKDPNRESYSVFCGETIFVFEKSNGEYQFTDVGEND